MKILVLGGAGDMGANGANLLTKFPGIEKNVLSDMNHDAVSKKAKEIHSPLGEKERMGYDTCTCKWSIC